MKNNKKFYVVRKGRKKGMFFSWKECQKQINGFSGAEFKSFDNYTDAQRYLDGGVKIVQNTRGIKGLVAYVDGSYNSKTIEAGFGCVLLMNDKVVEELQGSVALNKSENSRNVEGELQAALEAVYWATENSHEKITIVYDYNGIEKWAIGEWKTNKALTRSYAAEMKNLKKHIEIDFVKVKAHSGQKYNERADYLAKEVIGLA